MWQPRLSAHPAQKYLGLVDALESDIRAGRVAPGERLPPQRTVALALDLSMTTVTRAFNEARRRGLVDAKAGGGTVIRNRGTDLAINLPPQPAESDLRKILPRGIAKGLAGPRSLLSLRFQASHGIDSDRQAGAAWLGTRLATTAAERIVLTAGAQAALYALCHLLFKPGDVVLAGAAAYPGLRAVALQQGLILAPVAIDAQGLIPEDVERAIQAHAAKGLYLVPSIDNPTTATLPDTRRHALAAIARRHGLTVLEDDPYAPLRSGLRSGLGAGLGSGREPALADLLPDLTWHIATLSKCATPALRIAYVQAPNEEGAGQLAHCLKAMSLMAPPLMGALASRWIADGTLADLTRAIRAENAARQRVAAQALDDAYYWADPHGHHLWLHLKDDHDARALALRADETDLPVVAAAEFAPAGDATGAPLGKAVRVSLGLAPDHATLRNRLARLAAMAR